MTGGDEVDDELIGAFGDEMMRFNRRKLVMPRESCLDLSAFRILHLLAERGPLGLRDLADALDLDQSTISRQTSAVIKRGLAERVSLPDHPTYVLRPTKIGSAAHEHDRALRTDRYRRALRTLGPERADRLVADLRAVNDEFEIDD